jgi:hypothetical protein
VMLAFALAQLRPAAAQEIAPYFAVVHWKSWMTMGVSVRRSRCSPHNRRPRWLMARSDIQRVSFRFP